MKAIGLLLMALFALGISARCPIPAKAGSVRVHPTLTETDGVLRVTNGFYDMGFRASDGGITHLRHIPLDRQLLGGTEPGRLWWADAGTSRINSSTYKGSVSHAWDAGTGTLTLDYQGSTKKPGVKVTLGFDEGPGIRISAAVTNSGDAVIGSFSIPGDLGFPLASVDSALLPMLPGVLLDKGFFTGLKRYEAVYPGAMFADYTAIGLGGAHVAVFGGKGERVQPASMGFEPVGGRNGRTRLIHSYRTWIRGGSVWHSPPVWIRIGADYPETIAAYREAKGIGAYKPIAEKLGSMAWRFLSSPLYKLDMGQAGTGFNGAKSIIDGFSYPGILHPVAFQPGGFDNNYPDFLPPNPDMGTVGELSDLMAYARKKGHLIVPYTNFSWWDSEGSWLDGIEQDPGLGNVTVAKRDGQPLFEAYGDNGGYVVDPSHPFVKGRTAAQVAGLREAMGTDGLFGDQWGARVPPLDYGKASDPAVDPSTSYFGAVMDHVREYADQRLFTECGVDVLAEYGTGFNGTNLLWDMKGYRPDTAPHTSYYPMSGMLMRDKVLLYQHDLAPETFTQGKGMLRWNMAMGYNQSVDFNSPWAKVAGAFQKHVLPGYAASLVKGFSYPEPGLSFTDFGTHGVYADWSGRERSIDGFTIPGEGFMAYSKDGAVRAGVYTAYNGGPLSKGEHYVIEVREPKAIRVYQPKGGDTVIRIVLPPGWDGVATAAKAPDGRVLGTVKAVVGGGFATFTLTGSMGGKTVGYHELVRH